MFTTYNIFKINKIIHKLPYYYSNYYRNYVSALYLTGDKAKEHFQILTPYVNFNEIFNNADEMKNNLSIRKINIDFNELIKKYELYKSIKDEENLLQKERENIAFKLKSIPSNSGNQEEINKIKSEGKLLREKYKQLKEKLFPIEEDFMDNFLKLPNKIHNKAHPFEHTILYRHGLPAKNQNFKSHTEFKDLIKFKNDSYYLMKDAAIFDLEFLHQCTDYFLSKDNNFVQTSNPDFSRTILLEAATLNQIDYDTVDEKIETECKINLLHLAGGASLSGFLGFIAKTAIFPSNLPLKLITNGRQYFYNNENHIITNLYNTNQTNALQIFCCYENENELDDEMEKILNLTVDIYKKLNIHFRIIYAKPDEMYPAETLRSVIQIYSPIHSKYINVGHISNYSNFISKRLLFILRDKNIQKKFPYILSGTIIDTAKIIACLLENGKDLSVPNYNEKNVEKFINIFN